MSGANFQMPERIELDEASYSNTFGRFYIQPLEKGYGVTIGNMFRRILLSSLQGAGITAIRIDDIQHEFSSIQGVFEDVTEVILNLKQVRLKLLNKRVDKVTIPFAVSVFRPSSWASRSVMSFAMKSTILFSTASSAEYDLASVTVSSSALEFLFLLTAILLMNALVSSLIFSPRVFGKSFPPLATGDAAPIFVPGAITAKLAATVMKVPAEAAWAPGGDT